MPLKATPQGVNLRKEPSLGLNQGFEGEPRPRYRNWPRGLYQEANARPCGRHTSVTDPNSRLACYHLHHWGFLVWVACVLESVPRNMANKPMPPSPQRPALFVSHNHIGCQRRTWSWLNPVLHSTPRHYSAPAIAFQAVSSHSHEAGMSRHASEAVRSKCPRVNVQRSQKTFSISGCLDIRHPQNTSFGQIPRHLDPVGNFRRCKWE